MENVIIVGSGIGSLCTAIRLLNRKYNVTILEKEKYVGGKINRKQYKNYRFDLTASILMTPNVYTKIFEDINKDYREYFEMEKIDHLYTVNYYDKTKIEIFMDSKKMKNILENNEIGLYEKYNRFLKDSLNKYNIYKNQFLDKPMININEVINLKALDKIIKINPTLSCDKYISKFIDNEKLKNFIMFQAMYIGVDPYSKSNLYASIAAITEKYGLCYIKGGFYNYILALEKVITELNGKIITNEEVKETIIKKNKVCGVKTKSNYYRCDKVIVNAEYTYALKEIIHKDINEKFYTKKNVMDKEYSCSVFMIYLITDKKYNNLNLHNIYLTKEFEESIRSPFKGTLAKHPLLYIYCPSSIDKSICNENEDMINIMVRVPNLSFKNIKYDKETISDFRNNIFKEIKNITGMEDIEEHIKYEEYLTPMDLKNKFNCVYGNAFGLSHKLLQSVYFRPHLKAKDIKGLYFIGTSTHPGNGASIIIEGSRVLEKIICSDNN